MEVRKSLAATMCRQKGLRIPRSCSPLQITLNHSSSFHYKYYAKSISLLVPVFKTDQCLTASIKNVGQGKFAQLVEQQAYQFPLRSKFEQ